MKKEKSGYFVLTLSFLAAVISLFFMPVIRQKEVYHDFSDRTQIFGIPNFLNVVSNLPFLVVGLWGLFKLSSFYRPKIQYLIFFLGVSLVSFGSGYYHLHPDNNTLIWDRLPMTIAFMALFSIIISEYINPKVGRILLWPLLVIGISSVLYWVVSGDLRLYALVQYYPMLAIPVILLCFKSRYTMTSGYWLLLLAYLIAKLFEYYDYQIQQVLVVVSGHTLKHIIASLGIFILLYTYLKRKEEVVPPK